jgi:hypothetical protein
MQASPQPMTIPSPPLALLSFRKIRWKLLSIVGLVAASLFVASLSVLVWVRSEVPFTVMQGFVTKQLVGSAHAGGGGITTLLNPIEELPLDDLHISSGAACAYGLFENVRQTLKQQLCTTLDAHTVDAVLSVALREGVSTSSTLTNVQMSPSDKGTGDYSFAFWSSEHVLANTYSTCILISSVRILIAEQVAEWTTTKERRQIGSHPCHCGWAYCMQCPDYQDMETHIPIFKRHALSIKQQSELGAWMQRRATEEAEALIRGHTSQQLQLPGVLKRVFWPELAPSSPTAALPQAE